MVTVMVMILLGSYVAVADDMDESKRIGFFTVAAIITALKIIAGII